MKMCIRRLAYALSIVGVVAGINGCKSEHKQQPQTRPSIPNLSVNHPPAAPTGSPAIKSRSNGSPAFTVDDVKQYITADPLLGPAVKQGKATITTAEFITSKELSERWHGVTAAFPDSYPLCYVELQGSFTFFGPPGSKVTYNKEVLVFDAHSGNLVITGGRR
jgi:hypothetical protein